MKEYQRKQLLERIDREGATVGTRIPESIEVDGETLDLRAFVFESKRRETVPPGERERVEAAKRSLRRERIERAERIERGEVSYEEGRELVESIVGIDRALNALDQLDPVDLEAESRKREAADRKRWLTFLNRALGREEGRSRNSR